jgi:hypothetical protein
LISAIFEAFHIEFHIEFHIRLFGILRYFLNPPVVNFSFTGVGKLLERIDVGPAIENAITDVMSNIMVLPNRM